MSYQAILRSISQYVRLSEPEQAAFVSHLTIRRLKKKEFLLQAGEICLHENYVNKGCLRTYYLDEEGIERNYYFAIEDWWISDIQSRTYRAPSSCFIVALEDCELVQISQSSLEEVLGKVPQLERFFRILYQHSLAGHQLKFLQMLHLNGQQRYTAFRNKYPQFEKRIPQKHIATYLGLTPEFFNTIRSKVLKDT